MVAPEVYDQEVDLIRRFKLTGAPPTTETMDTLLQHSISKFQLDFLPSFSTEQTVVRYELRSIVGRTEVDPNRKPPNRLTYGSLMISVGDPAVDTGLYNHQDLLPPTDSVSIESRTEGAGRGAFGVHRVGFVPAFDSNNGNLVPGGIANWNAVAIAMGRVYTLPGAGGIVVEPVIFNQFRFCTVGAPAGNPSAYAATITSSLLARRLGTQKTRKRPIQAAGR